MIYGDFIYDPFYIQRVREVNVKFSNKALPLFREPHRELKEFTIKGYKVMAYSRKDAITRLKYMKKK